MNATDIEATTRSLAELVWQNDREGATQRVGEIAAADLGLVVSRMDSSDRCEQDVDGR